MERRNITQLTGFAWYVFEDETTSAGAAGAHPFGDEPVADDTAPPVNLPGGVLACWVRNRTAQGLRNFSNGRGYLVLTEELQKPGVNAGWDVEPARLDENFEMDQRGTRWVRLARTIQTRDSEWGPVLYGEFALDHSDPKI